MIDGAEIQAIAEHLSLPPAVIERDCVAGWLAAGIASNELLGSTWILTGGLALRKCLTETCRFSGALEYTTTDPTTFAPARLRQAFDNIVAWIRREAGFLLPHHLVQFELGRNERREYAGQGFAHYAGPLAPAALAAPRNASSPPAIYQGVHFGDGLPVITMRVIAKEPLALPVRIRRFSHPYSDATCVTDRDPRAADPFLVRCCSRDEMVADQLLALATLARPGDLYDLVTLFRDEHLRASAPEVRRLLRRRCEQRQVPVPTAQNMTAAGEHLGTIWQRELTGQISALPPFDMAWHTLQELFAWLDTGYAPATPAAIPLGSGHTVFRAPFNTPGTRRIRGARFIEPLRFAALQRLCVDLMYESPNGDRRTRTIEPYSLRQTLQGDLLLMAAHVDIRNLRSYRLDRVRGLRVTATHFTPRFAVDLLPFDRDVRGGDVQGSDAEGDSRMPGMPGHAARESDLSADWPVDRQPALHADRQIDQQIDRPADPRVDLTVDPCGEDDREEAW